ncbi:MULTISPECIES: Mu-like prophage major head subunit gpT family protein [Salipiger]|uniref:Mu-like prophage major head subunit gpT n=1 Tax=Salipiger profundus TaxID=1229727 RepID=A0A1U7CZL5_9RHOB|nr:MULTISPECIES: Mu-like prophage major head subunit gpT family protein [Salipiger]ALF02056.1 major capsid protein [Thiobacimonas phage vB_ThpS-P1]APX21280.1 Mu-like prophage major head subunit gpT [Salipiger profundus]GGA03605.1 head protein [Salipiger profundus]
MIITATALQALRVGFKTEFQKALDGTPTMRDRVATVVRSSTSESTYGWLKKMSGMREWLGPRQLDGIAEAQYTIRNKHFEKTVEVNRNDIEDDNLGQYSMMFGELGDAAGAHPETLVWNLLKAGFSTECWDGQNFFDSDHPITDEDGAATTFSNTGGGSGTPWFLLCTNKSIKPILLQERKPITFTYKDRPDDDNVFFNNTYVYGADWRGNVGFGVPQMAYGSQQTLDATSYAAARTAIQNMKGDGGRPLGLMPNLLVVPPSLESAGRKLLNSEYAAGGETNEWKGTAELLVVPWLA